MKKILLTVVFLFFGANCWAQNSPVVGAGIMPSGPTIPTVCNPANVGDADSQAMFFHTTSAGGAVGLYVCGALNTWNAAGAGSVSGQANNVIPKGTTATTITQQSSCTDNGTTFSCTEPVASTGAVTAGTGCTPAGATATGGVCMTEAASTGWTATAGFDYMRADSTQHKLVCSYNGGAEVLCAISALSGITAATGTNTIANGNNTQFWNWSQTTNTQAGMTFGETAAATNGSLTNALANQSEVTISTASASTATPLNILQGSVTGTVAFPAAQFQTTWNNAGLSGRGLGISLTNTSSALTSYPLFVNVGNTTLLAVDTAGMIQFNGNAAISSAPPSSGIANTNGWRYCLNNANGGAGTTCVGVNSQEEYHNVNNGGTGWFTVGSAAPSGGAGGTAPSTAAYSALWSGIAGGLYAKEGSCAAGFTNNAGASFICADSTLHEFLVNTNGDSMASHQGMLVRRQPAPVSSTGLTAPVANGTTLCAASAGACNVAGQYHVHINVWGSGTACGTPSPGGVTPNLSWTDENGIAHANVVIPMMSQTGASSTAVNVAAPTVAFQSALANEGGSGDFTLSTNGTVIQYGVAYAACSGGGTGTYNIRISVNREQ